MRVINLVIELYAVIGADGFLGSYLMKSILENTDDMILAASRSEQFYGKESKRVIPCTGDLRNKTYRLELVYKINSAEGTNIIYTAGESSIDRTADDPDKAHEINVDILDKIVSHLYNFGKLFFMSSDAVYGEGGQYRFKEKDSLSPLSIYAEQKIESEKIIGNNGGVSLRLPLMYAESLAPDKKNFYDTIVDMLRNNEEVPITVNAVRSALDFKTAADIIVKLCSYEGDLPPVINIGGDIPVSWYELGIGICNKINVSPSMIIPYMRKEEFARGAKRAQSTLMDNSLVKELLGMREIIGKI